MRVKSSDFETIPSYRRKYTIIKLGPNDRLLVALMIV